MNQEDKREDSEETYSDTDARQEAAKQRPPTQNFEPDFENRIDLSGIKKLVENIRTEIGKIIVGQRTLVDQLIAGLLANGHVLIEGVPGVAKTLTAKLLARVLNVGFSRIQFTPDLMPSDVIGTSVFNPDTTNFEFKSGPVFANLVLIDEINRSPAKTQAALFEVMEERQVTVDGKTYPMDPPFMVMATQNPIEHEGTYRLPEAQLDRFLFKIEVTYPSLEEEIDMLDGLHDRKNINDPSILDPVIEGDQISSYQEIVSQVHLEPALMRYIAEIIHKTRDSSSIYIGASPRASVYVMRTAQAWAAMNGRDFVIPEDVQYVLYPVLRHRLILTPEKEMEGVNPDQVIKSVIQKVKVPR